MSDSKSASFQDISRNGLWHQNPALVQLLGLCPLLAVSGSVATSLGLAVTTLLVLTGANLTVSLIRHHIDDTSRLPMLILVIATFVTLADLVLQSWFFELHQRIGLFVALIVTNCTLLGRAEVFASRQPVLAAATDGFMMGLGFGVVLLVMGAIREVLGHGTLFADLDKLTGLPDLTVHVMDGGFLLMILPPGAFLTLGCLIALKNLIDHKRHQPAPVNADK